MVIWRLVRYTKEVGGIIIFNKLFNKNKYDVINIVNNLVNHSI